jgi:hypothetical protein
MKKPIRNFEFQISNFELRRLQRAFLSMLFSNILRTVRLPTVRQCRPGFTLVELAVAVSTSAIVIGTIFFGWTAINRHVAENQRKALFQLEARRVATTIASQIRRSPQVLAWYGSGITFISPTSADTLTYEWYGTEMRRNDTPLVVISPTARITDFSIEEESSGNSQAQFGVLLHIRMKMEDDFGNETAYLQDVAISPPREEDTKDKKKGWNF